MTRAWNRFWFADLPAAELAVYRIAWVGVQLACLVCGDLAERIAKYPGPAAPGYEPLPILRLLALPLGGAGALGRVQLDAVFVVTLLAGLLALVGWRTRWSLVVFALGSLLLDSWVFSTDSLTHHLALLEWALFLLAFTPCGAVFSLDARRSRRSKETHGPRATDLLPGAAWIARLVHALLALAYLSAALTKVLRGPGEWFSGWTMQYYVSFHTMRSGSTAGRWLMESHTSNVAIAWLVIALEIGFALSVWFPRVAWIWALAAILVHAGAAVFMGVVFPSFPVLCAALIPWCRVAEGLETRWRRLRGRGSG
jgi:hypothetical protein